MHRYWRQSTQQASRKCYDQPHLFLLSTSPLPFNEALRLYPKHLFRDIFICSKWLLKDNRICGVLLCLALFALLINFWTSKMASSQLRMLRFPPFTLKMFDIINKMRIGKGKGGFCLFVCFSFGRGGKQNKCFGHVYQSNEQLASFFFLLNQEK